MKHLSSFEVVEALEGDLAPTRQAHVDACDACRREIRELDAAMRRVTGVAGVPEPSPLFWTFFGDRVRAAVAPVPVPARSPWWQGWLRPVVALAAMGLCAVAIGLVARHSRPTVTPAPVVASAADSAPDGLFDVPDDPSVDVVAAAVGDLSWDQVRAANLMPRAGTVDAAVAQLTDEQQKELIRLLRAAMNNSAE